MPSDSPVPETRVLAIASHVVYGYVGNTMAAFVMQVLGCEVAALNTVQFSNHTAYKQCTGTKTSADEIRVIYDGLKQSSLTAFDVLLSGYAPSAEAVEAIGAIGRDLHFRSTMKPGSFFWVLDPVMGDQGRLYVAEDVVPVYKRLLREADLILPNQFEAEVLAGVQITSLGALKEAVGKLHREHRVPHIVVTSVSFDASSPTLSVVGSTRRADGSPRFFAVDVPRIDCFFSGTGDMFAALTVVRLREAVAAAGLSDVVSWVSPDDVGAADLPLAKAVEKVLASMHAVLRKTKTAMGETLKGMEGGALDMEEVSEKRMHLRRTKASEVRLVRNLDDLRHPVGGEFRARALETEAGWTPTKPFNSDS
ncbi:putative pyridoxal kinase [Lambiella insularis]|nr:putative pyridoxal kinase [Lambiella insularis]